MFESVRKCHEKIHLKGYPGIYKTMKLNASTDKEQRFSDKVKLYYKFLNRKSNHYKDGLDLHEE